MRVTLRERKIKHGRLSLYLDYYPPIVIDGKPKRFVSLDLFVYQKPASQTERDHNKETRLLAKAIEAQRQLELQAASHGFTATSVKRKSFNQYFKRNYLKRPITDSSKDTYHSTYRHLEKFGGRFVLMSHVTAQFCRDFKNYLETHPDLARNTASTYFSAFCAIIKDGVNENLLHPNPLRGIKGIAREETEKEYLSIEELQKLMATDYPSKPEMRRSVFFAAYTGLRFSDIEKLVWSEIRRDSSGWYIKFRQQKTSGMETLPFSDEAAECLGNRGKDTDKVFPSCDYQQYAYHIPLWCDAAGITKHITFHCFRVSFATLQLSLGTDIFTVSKMLGHRSLSSTLHYVELVDKNKQEAANRIRLK